MVSVAEYILTITDDEVTSNAVNDTDTNMVRCCCAPDCQNVVIVVKLVSIDFL